MSALKRAAIISLQLISSSSTCVSIVRQSFSQDAHVDDSRLSIVIIFNELQTPTLQALNYLRECVYGDDGGSHFHSYIKERRIHKLMVCLYSWSQ